MGKESARTPLKSYRARHRSGYILDGCGNVLLADLGQNRMAEVTCNKTVDLARSATFGAMLFNSLAFFVFFFVVCIFYFALPHRFRWLLLLAASWFFYACWNTTYLGLLLGKTFATQALTIQIEKSVARRRLGWLIASLTFNFGVLFVFKYFNFFSDSARVLCAHMGLVYTIPTLDVLLPIGISFYTFQAVGYSIDVYRGDLRAERHPGIFGLFVAFFPQLVAGPIERAGHMLPQFRREHDFDAERIALGLKMMLWGYFKKVVVADRLALYVNEVYGHPGDYQGLRVWLATYFFAFQIYCDFSGYSDIAIGAARVLGFDLMENFRRPYFSKSVAEFWRRWHISLSTWFRDYLYFPLGGNRGSRARTAGNLMLVFLLSGLWHGANWTFLVWGALHGFYMLVPLALRFPNTPSPTLWRRTLAAFVTFHLVCFAWIFFRAETLSDAWTLLHQAFSFVGWRSGVTFQNFGYLQLLIALFSLAVLVVVEWSERAESLHFQLARRPRWKRWAFYQFVLVFTLLFGVWHHSAFLYFQF